MIYVHSSILIGTHFWMDPIIIKVCFQHEIRTKNLYTDNSIGFRSVIEKIGLKGKLNQAFSSYFA